MEGIPKDPTATVSQSPGNCVPGAEVDRSVADLRPYLVSHDVYLALMDNCAVMLHRGVYHTFGIPETKALALGTRAWPNPGSDAALSAVQSRFLMRLEAKGVLTRDTRRGRPMAAASISSPSRSLLDHDLDWVRPRITGTHLGPFCRAMLVGRMRQIRRPLESLALWVVARRARQTGCISLTAYTDLQRLVHIFRRLRPLIFAGRDRCVLDTLGLFEFLALNGTDLSGIRWVVGVRARPWGAHCWLQQDELVLNDTCKRVMQYVPILVA